jgi:hypothetical protein
MYNHGFDKVKEFWHEVMITIDDSFLFQDKLVKSKVFDGGKYLTYNASLSNLTSGWQKVMQHVSAEKIPSGKHQWIEEWELDNWNFPVKEITILYPIA